MSKENTGGNRPDGRRVMSRGEFLGTGAVAAAGVGLGAVPMVEPSEGDAAKAACGLTCPPVAFEWAIPAGVLNTLWGDIFPRLVAREWRNPGTTSVGAGMTAAQLQAELTTLSGSTDFMARVALVNAHFGSTNHVPFSVRGEGGYDFLLSDQGGLEFFLPDPPQTLAELLRYYSFRGTGRPAIGLPHYLDRAISAVSIDSPTGPSQIRVSMSTVLQVVSQVDPSCVDLLCLRPRSTEREVLIGVDAYRCAVEGVRCWQLEGAVYRGLMVEIPRIVAIAWMEVANGTSTQPRSYFGRLSDPSSTGLRSIFEERLETSLAGDSKMHFEIQPNTPPPGPNGTVLPWDPTDVMVTNKGLFLPQPPALDANQVTAMNRILDEMVGGRAGNPVFTDSKRTMQ